MPSVFTIAGTDRPAKKAASSNGLGVAVGHCKTVKNPRTGCSMQLCFVGKGAKLPSGKKSRTGWAFQSGSSKCSRR